MEKRKLNVMMNKAGGNAGSNSFNYRISIPAKWAKAMNISQNDKSVNVFFDGEQIVIRKAQENE